MSHVVIATFEFISPEARQSFLDILSSPDGLAKTRAWPGCKLIECSIPPEEEIPELILYERWDQQSDHESYMAMRKETGLFVLLEDLLEGGAEGLDVERYNLQEV